MTTARVTDAPARRIQTDVVVVGARCAGAATAMLLAARGHEVLLLDRDVFPSDTVSTHALARPGVVQLHRWGVLDRVLESGAPPIRRVEFHVGDDHTVHAVKDRHGVDLLVAPRRYVLDALLQDAARAAGAVVLTDVDVDDVLVDAQGRVSGVRARDVHGPLEVRASFVVGADGLMSGVARAVDAPMTEVRPSTGATQYAYFAGDWPAMEYHLGDGGFAGAFPTHGGEACIWVCTPEDRARRTRRETGSPDDALTSLITEVAPHLARRLPDAVRTSSTRGMLRMLNHVRRPFGRGWVLVGDAGHHRDAITGLGMSDAFRDAELAAAVDEAIRRPVGESRSLAAYESRRDRMLRAAFDITVELGGFPGPARFTELQKELAHAIDRQAAELSALTGPRTALASA